MASTAAEDVGGGPFKMEGMADKAATVPVRGMVAMGGTEPRAAPRIRTADRVVMAVTGECGVGCRATAVTADMAGLLLATAMLVMVATVGSGAVHRTFLSIVATRAGAAAGVVTVATLRGPVTGAMEGTAAMEAAVRTRPVAKAVMAETAVVRSTGPAAKEVTAGMAVLRRRSVVTEEMAATGATDVRSVVAVSVAMEVAILGSTTLKTGTRAPRGLVRAIPLLLGGMRCSFRRKSASGPSS